MIRKTLHLASRITALTGGELAGGIVMINKSIGLNPNHSAGMEEAAMLYAYAGDRQSDVTHLERSVRLNPVNRILNFYFSCALIHLAVGEHDGVVEWTGRALQAGRVSVCLVALRKAVRSFDSCLRWFQTSRLVALAGTSRSK